MQKRSELPPLIHNTDDSPLEGSKGIFSEHKILIVSCTIIVLILVVVVLIYYFSKRDLTAFKPNPKGLQDRKLEEKKMDLEEAQEREKIKSINEMRKAAQNRNNQQRLQAAQSSPVAKDSVTKSGEMSRVGSLDPDTRPSFVSRVGSPDPDTRPNTENKTRGDNQMIRESNSTMENSTLLKQDTRPNDEMKSKGSTVPDSIDISDIITVGENSVQTDEKKSSIQTTHIPNRVIARHEEHSYNNPSKAIESLEEHQRQNIMNTGT